jgi:hypothetical protein
VSIYYDPGDATRPSYLPIFREAEWELAETDDGQPLVVAEGSAGLTLFPSGSPAPTGYEVVLEVTCLRPGRLEIASGDAPVRTLQLSLPGGVREVSLPPGDVPIDVVFRFTPDAIGEDGPTFAIASVTTRIRRSS